MSTADEIRQREAWAKRRLKAIADGIGAELGGMFHSGGFVGAEVNGRPMSDAAEAYGLWRGSPGFQADDGVEIMAPWRPAPRSPFLSGSYALHAQHPAVACAAAQLRAARGPAMREKAERHLNRALGRAGEEWERSGCG